MSVTYRDEQFEPRRVRLTATGRSRVTTLFAILGILAVVQGWALSRAYSAGGFRPAMLIAPVIVLFALWMVRTLLVTERDLLLTGALTTGHVTEVAKSPKGAMVTFKYSDASGTLHKRTARDTSDALRLDDPVPVFYDRSAPGRCAITPGSFYELI